ncbi:FAD-binding oxidoreductase [Kribbella kalugense]|uniref:FAD/FMN-containing dehydrogenase n=1 Tax=Kribbella kalugense TaxID=2512221 RepID=A0A4R7ZH07_9ACTN|nr:FAD-binding oxidoreductase [Kribbella kalugense]TDW15641.1 FAD/FMN-containing dehydrogenase [Kribbella kalugense]
MRPTGFGGVLLQAGDSEYDAARTVFNAMVDRKPAMIAQCESAADVQAAVRYGVARELEISVRGGGHAVTGAAVSDGGLVVDLRRMNSVQVDPFARIARVGGGATWSDLDRAGQPYCLLTTGGRVPSTGVAGLTLGGGSGWLERKLGLASDALISVELVTADGQLLIADETKNTELFWALHGGGGNFGVATSLTFRLTQVVTTTLALLVWPQAAGPSVLRAYRDLFEAGASEDLGGGVEFLTGPPASFVPEGLQGQPVVMAVAVYAGGVDETREAFEPMFALAPEGQFIAEMPYTELQAALDSPAGFRNYWSAEHLRAFPDPAVLAFCDRAREMISPSPSQQVVLPWGGAVRRGAGDWPQAYRYAEWVAHPFGAWTDPCADERGIRWARDVCSDLEPWSTGHVYLNFIGHEGQERVIAGFGTANYKRLARVKCQYDPENVFQLNQNIEPGWST